MLGLVRSRVLSELGYPWKPAIVATGGKRKSCSLECKKSGARCSIVTIKLIHLLGHICALLAREAGTFFLCERVSLNSEQACLSNRCIFTLSPCLFTHITLRAEISQVLR